MASERFKGDANFKAGGVIGGYSSADAIGEANPTLIVARFDPITGRLLVDATVSGEGVADGDPVDAATLGFLMLGTDGSNYQVVSTNSSGRLQVDVVSGGGGGTQYTEGDTDTSITGTAMLMEGAANTLVVLQGDATNGLLVNLGANNDVTVTGSVTANAGTNLNTSLLAVESGGNLAAVATSLAALDNSVDGNYLNVNMNLAGVDAPSGGGTESGVLRVTIATDSTGVLSIDDNGGSLTVDAPVGTPVFVRLSDGSAAIATLPVSLASVPSHAVTNAGTFVVQENGSALTSLQLIDDVIYTSGDTLSKTAGIAAQFDDVTPGAMTENKMGPVRMSSRRELYVTLRDAAGNERGLNVDSNGAIAITVASIPSHAVTNAGTFVVQENGSALTSLQLIDDPVIADDSAFTPATSKVMMAGFEADETSTDSVDEGDAGAARMTLDRKVIVTVQPHTAGGWSTFNATSGDTFTALTNSAQAVKASAGQLGGWYIYNPNSSAAYVIIYNIAAASVTVGTSTPKLVLAIPASSAANLELVNGIPFDTAISVAAATTGGGNTAPSTALECMLWYK